MCGLFLITQPWAHTNKSDNTRRNHALIVLLYISTHVQLYKFILQLVTQPWEREITSEAENSPTSKKPWLSLYLKWNWKQPTSSSRCICFVAFDVDVEKAVKGVLPVHKELLKSGLEFVVQLTHQSLSQRTCYVWMILTQPCRFTHLWTYYLRAGEAVTSVLECLRLFQSRVIVVILKMHI